jgi:hypothetical protein
VPLVRFIVVGLAKTLSKVFGLATMTFFGRMPSRDSDKMALVGLMSLTWWAVVAGIVFPDVAELVPGMPEDDGTRRMIAAATAVVMPPINGAIVSRLHNRRNSVGDTLVQLVASYLYTAVIGGVVIGIVVTVPIVKASYIFRRFQTKHLLVMIPEGSYDDAYGHVMELLDDYGAKPEQAKTNPLVRAMFRALTYVVEYIFRRDVATDMRVIRGELGDGGWYEITMHATDITILGKDAETSTLLPLLADEIDERLVYFTWDDDSQAIEDRMRECRTTLEEEGAVEPGDITQLVEEVRGLGLDLEEWSALRRNLYRLERDAYRRMLDRDSESSTSA